MRTDLGQLLWDLPHTLVRGVVDLEIRRAERTCAKDPLWKALHDKSVIRDERGTIMGYTWVPEDQAQLREIGARLAPDVWWLPAAGFLLRRPVRRARRKTVTVVRRGIYGWAPEDCVNLGHSLCETLAPRLLWLAEQGSGYPGTGQYTAAAAWKADLTRHSTALQAYAIGGTSDHLILDAQEALRWVAEWLPHLWD